MEDSDFHDGAIGRVYLARHLSPEARTRIERHLQKHARAPFRLTPWGNSRGSWTCVSLWDMHDLDMCRAAFPRLIDGWRLK
ncbi:hypothetical protein [Ancylobacter sp. TS-1]|uniref:hypothetical protein n=1 Tax=Ancylobacter sp. TS-1 TaxID=1850374 RepID=UPI001265BAE6|nr:hypothetical protein [Ancylobacter sp. TS-1]QFR34693.1 hypothetical protein GBB76_17165 [Ancylobacter sp. TS-1]